MRINIFDKNFITYDKSSTFGKAPRSFNYVKGLRQFDGITIYTDKCFNMVKQTKSKYNIAWQVESPVHSGKDFYPMLNYKDKFDMIFTYDDDLIQQDPRKFKRVNFGGTTVSKPSMYPKTKDICIVHSGKKDTFNHSLRAKIINKYGGKGVDVFGKVTGKPFKNIQDVYKDYKYAIVIENICHPNYFSEKLTDAMACGTIPIYLGSSRSVDTLFDERGVMKWKNLNELDNIIDKIIYDEDMDGHYDFLKERVLNDNLINVATNFYTNEDWLYTNYIRNFVNEQK
jgi:hypothetical protein